MLYEAARSVKRKILHLKDLPNPVDCPGLPDGPYPSKSVLVTLQ
jgi:hypothetical protein